MPLIIDAHLDMAANAVGMGRDLRRPLQEIRDEEARAPRPDRSWGAALVSLPELRRGQIAVVGASLFTFARQNAGERRSQEALTAELHAQGVAQLDYYRRLADDEQERVQLLLTEADLDAVWTSWDTPTPRIGLFIVMEGAGPIREPAELSWWIERGLRGVGPAWSTGSRYAGGNAAPGGFSEAGRQLLARMADANLLLDVSHLWEEAVYEALDSYPGTLVATHANPRALADGPRQLPDDLIRRIAERGGVMGVVPYNTMLHTGWQTGDPRPPLSRLIEAIDHICQTAGQAACVGLGSDFDGGFGLESIPAEMNSIADLGQIASLLRERGYAEADITGILHGNWLHSFRQVLRAR